MSMNPERHVVIIGAGPAGLTAAYQLAKAQVRATVLEKDAVVGGISRTASHRGFCFDIGGHRFFTKVDAVNQMWREVLTGADFLSRPRLSRIYYRQRFFHYPLRPINALAGLGAWNSLLILASYVKARLFPRRPERTFEQWVTNRFGARLYRTFFKTYTEKVWGMPCSEISAEWAAQRIKGLSLFTAVKNALFGGRNGGSGGIKTLIDTFDYPRKGPGMMWEAVLARACQGGAVVRLKSPVEKIHWQPGGVTHVEAGELMTRVTGTNFLSTMPVRELIEKMDPAPPPAILAAARSLKYRDFLTVALVVGRETLFPDNWIYVHDPAVKVGRIQNFKNWSPDMVPDPRKTCIGLEYFCFEHDGLWSMPDEALVALASTEIAKLGLVRREEIEDGVVVRMPKAYPVYDATYRDALATVRTFLAQLPNLQLIGRNGMHKYNNQDHSMLTAMLAVKNILGGRHDLWEVNADENYHEEIGSDEARRQLAVAGGTQPHVPERV
jgi:protoporphyrinogen oxidase